MSDVYSKLKQEGVIPAYDPRMQYAGTDKPYNSLLQSSLHGNFLRPTVLIESPFRNQPMAMHYLGVCVKDSIARGEAPIASHGFYPQWLDDKKPEERELGFDCWRGIASTVSKVILYHDLGISEGMRYALSFCNANRINIEFRSLGDDWKKQIVLVPQAPKTEAIPRPEPSRLGSEGKSSVSVATTK